MNDCNRVLRALDFSAKRHIGQTRKGAKKTPYINHPISVMALLAEFNEDDPDLLCAAALHDVIEDTTTGKNEIEELSREISTNFGDNVLNIVLEVSDDKTLPFQERKYRQIIHTPYLSREAKKLKIADKTCNVKDMMIDPPDDWSMDRKITYLEWATKVIDGARGLNSKLEQNFDKIVREAYNKFTNQNI